MKNSFKEMKLEELVAKREELAKKLFDLRFQMVIGHVENPLQKRCFEGRSPGSIRGSASASALAPKPNGGRYHGREGQEREAGPAGRRRE
jgi:ribosomal protein L29